MQNRTKQPFCPCRSLIRTVSTRLDELGRAMLLSDKHMITLWRICLRLDLPLGMVICFQARSEQVNQSERWREGVEEEVSQLF